MNVDRFEGQSYLQVTFASDEMKGIDLEYCHNLVNVQSTSAATRGVNEYDTTTAVVIARLINEMNVRVTTAGVSFSQQYMLKRGLKQFGDRGRQAAKKELDQLHTWVCFAPVSIAEMILTERKKAQEALMTRAVPAVVGD